VGFSGGQNGAAASPRQEEAGLGAISGLCEGGGGSGELQPQSPGDCDQNGAACTPRQEEEGLGGAAGMRDGGDRPLTQPAGDRGQDGVPGARSCGGDTVDHGSCEECTVADVDRLLAISVTTTTHIPERLRPQVGTVLSEAIAKASDGVAGGEEELLLLPRFLFRRTDRKDGIHWTNCLADRLKQWQEGSRIPDIIPVGHEKRDLRPPPRKVVSHATRASELVAEWEASRAMAALQSDDPPPRSWEDPVADMRRLVADPEPPATCDGARKDTEVAAADDPQPPVAGKVLCVQTLPAMRR